MQEETPLRRGRKPKDTKATTIYFSSATAEELSRRSREEGLNISFFVNKAVEQALEDSR